MQTRLLIGGIDGGSVVRVVGRGTMQESTSFRDAVLPHLDQGPVVFDASECDYLDSTFLGCLVGLQKAAEQSPSGRFVIAANESKRIQLFTTSALDKYFQFLDACPDPTTELAPVEIDALDKTNMGRHVAGCHERLAERGGPDAPAFKAVADRLSKELDRE